MAATFDSLVKITVTGLLVLGSSACTWLEDGSGEPGGNLRDRHAGKPAYVGPPVASTDPAYQERYVQPSAALKAKARKEIEPFSTPGVMALVRTAEQAYADKSWQSAVNAYRKAAALEPSNALIWYRLADSWLQSGDADQALAMAQRAEQRAGKDRRLRNWAKQLQDRARKATSNP